MNDSIIKFFKEHPELKTSDLDYMWDYCSSFPELGGKTVKMLKDQGLDWRDLNYQCLSSLPDLYKNIEEKVLNNLK